MDEDNKIGEIEETGPNSSADSHPRVKTKVPEVEARLYRQGKGPIESFKSSLGGWDQNQLEVRDILDKYGFKSLYAFNPQSGRWPLYAPLSRWIRGSHRRRAQGFLAPTSDKDFAWSSGYDYPDNHCYEGPSRIRPKV